MGVRGGVKRVATIRLDREGAGVVVTRSRCSVRYTDDDSIEEWQGLKNVEAEIRALKQKELAIEADISYSLPICY